MTHKQLFQSCANEVNKRLSALYFPLWCCHISEETPQPDDLPWLPKQSDVTDDCLSPDTRAGCWDLFRSAFRKIDQQSLCWERKKQEVRGQPMANVCFRVNILLIKTKEVVQVSPESRCQVKDSSIVWLFDRSVTFVTSGFIYGSCAKFHVLPINTSIISFTYNTIKTIWFYWPWELFYA